MCCCVYRWGADAGVAAVGARQQRGAASDSEEDSEVGSYDLLRPVFMATPMPYPLPLSPCKPGLAGLHVMSAASCLLPLLLDIRYT